MKVAVIGASNDHSKFGNKAVRCYKSNGHEVYPVHPSETEVEGLKAYAKVEDIEEELDEVLMYVPPKVGITVLEGIAKKGIRRLILNPGTANVELETRAKDLGIRVVHACAILAIGDTPAKY